MMKSATCLLCERDGKYLSVSRKDDSTKWGLVGGKVDPNESNAEAIQRETHEEVGVIASLISFQPLLSAFCPGDVNFWVTTYLWVDPYPIEDNELKAENGLTIDWKTEEELCDSHISPFSEYNKQVFVALREYQKE